MSDTDEVSVQVQGGPEHATIVIFGPYDRLIEAMDHEVQQHTGVEARGWEAVRSALIRFKHQEPVQMVTTF